MSGKGIAPDPEKLKAITKMDAPINRKQLKSFLGMVNYLSTFCPKQIQHGFGIETKRGVLRIFRDYLHRLQC